MVARALVLDIILWLDQRIARYQGENPQALDIHAPCPPPVQWRTVHVEITQTSACLSMRLELAIVNMAFWTFLAWAQQAFLS